MSCTFDPGWFGPAGLEALDVWLDGIDGLGMTGVDTNPCCATPAEILFNFPKDSRGTPRPAESLWKTKVSGAERRETANGFVLTTTSVERPATGGSGGFGQVAHLVVLVLTKAVG